MICAVFVNSLYNYEWHSPGIALIMADVSHKLNHIIMISIYWWQEISTSYDFKLTTPQSSDNMFLHCDSQSWNIILLLTSLVYCRAKCCKNVWNWHWTYISVYGSQICIGVIPYKMNQAVCTCSPCILLLLQSTDIESVQIEHCYQYQ